MSFPNWQLHRGYWQGGIRENTLSAFIEAKNQGCQMVEMDVQLNKDGVPHVFHDYDLKKFFHIDKKIKQISSDDLNALNVPTLSTILKSREIPQYLNIELKSLEIWARRLPYKVCDLVAKYEREEDVMISSFNPMCLYWARKALPEVKRGLLIGHPDALFDWKFGVSVALARPDYINAHYKLVDNEKARKKLLKYGRPLMVWTVNDYEKAEAYLGRGASSIISDNPPPAG